MPRRSGNGFARACKLVAVEIELRQIREVADLLRYRPCAVRGKNPIRFSIRFFARLERGISAHAAQGQTHRRASSCSI